MKNLLKMTIGLLILSGAGLAIADDALVQTKPVVKADLNTSANVGANDNVGKSDVNENGSADVNETDKVEVNKAALRDNDVNINMARKDMIRDTDKLSEDKIKLEDAQTAKDDQVISKAKTDIDNDKAAVEKDRERLK
jgi:hypothetical protein